MVSIAKEMVPVTQIRTSNYLIGDDKMSKQDLDYKRGHQILATYLLLCQICIRRWHISTFGSLRVAFLVFVFSASADAQAGKIAGPVESIDDLPLECFRFDLLEKDAALLKTGPVVASLGWTTSGVWVGQKEIVLTDLSFGKLARVPIGGFVDSGSSSFRRASDSESVEIVAPWYVYPLPGGSFLLLDLRGGKDSQIYSINASGEIELSMRTQGRTLVEDGGDGDKPREIEITGVFRMAPLAEGVLAFADLKNGEEEWSSFVYIEWVDDSYHAFNNDFAEPMRDLADKYFSRDLSYLATIGSTGFILVLENKPWIGRVDAGSPEMQRLELSEGMNLRSPDLRVEKRNSRQKEIEWMYKIYKTVEMSQTPFGIFSLEDRLFLLSKTSPEAATGEVRWSIFEISPKDASVIRGPFSLPTYAKDISLIPGSTFTAVVEKGGIDILDNAPVDILYRATKGMVMFPTSWYASNAGQSRSKGAAACGEIEIDTSPF